MRKSIFQEIEIPQGVQVSLDENIVKVKGPLGENIREINNYRLDVKIEEGKMTVGNKQSTKRQKKMINTITAHIKNMIKGVQEKFEYKLKICFSHFPMTAEVKDDKVTIKNFLGEKIPRVSMIPNGAEVVIDKEIVTVTSVNKEIAGQAAANLESATKVRGRDKRVFQDGIYITEKCGRQM